jgi:hypothetical protein
MNGHQGGEGMNRLDQDKNGDCEWLSLEEAWKRFFQQRQRRPHQSEFDKVADICDDLGAALFRIRDDNDQFYSRGHLVHVHPGFVVTKALGRHLARDDRFSGFPFGMLFSTYLQTNKSVEDNPPLDKVLCPIQGVRVNPTDECDYCGQPH